MRNPKGPHGSLNFPFNGLIIAFLVKAFLPLELRPLGQQSIKSQEREAKILLVGH